MPKQEASPGQRTTTDEMNLASDQVIQYYPTEGDLNAAWSGETIPDTTIFNIGDPVSEERRWLRFDGTNLIPAFLPPALNGGWDSHIDVSLADRRRGRTIFAEFLLNQPVPATSSEYTVEYRTVDDTARSSENDYTAIPWTTLRLSPGVQSSSIGIVLPAKGAATGPAERFFLELRNPSEGSLTFALGQRMEVNLLGSDAPIVLSIADASGNEGDKLTNRASISREATGDFTFRYNTAKGTTNPAPDAVYSQVRNALGTIPEGLTFVDLVNQSNDINERVFIADETYQVVIDPATLETSRPDNIATTGHDLRAVNTITRDQVVTANVYAELPSKTSVVRNSGTRYTLPDGSIAIGYQQQPSSRLPASVSQSRADTMNTWPFIVIRGSITSTEPGVVGSAVDAHFFYRIRRLFVVEADRTFNIVEPYVLGQRSGRVDIKRGDTFWWDRVSFMPRPADASAFSAVPRGVMLSRSVSSFYRKSTYDYLTPRYSGISTTTQGRAYVSQIQFYNPVGIKIRHTNWVGF